MYTIKKTYHVRSPKHGGDKLKMVIWMSICDLAFEKLRDGHSVDKLELVRTLTILRWFTRTTQCTMDTRSTKWKVARMLKGVSGHPVNNGPFYSDQHSDRLELVDRESISQFVDVLTRYDISNFQVLESI